MARTKDFVRDVALSRAIAVFSQHGFEGTSTEALLGAMGIGRQSLYDTFGDKWQLYLEALQRYSSDSIGAQLVVLEGAATGEAGLEALLMHAVARAREDPQPACLGVSAVCEFGRSEPEIVSLTEAMGRLLTRARGATRTRRHGVRCVRGRSERPYCGAIRPGDADRHQGGGPSGCIGSRLARHCADGAAELSLRGVPSAPFFSSIPDQSVK